jgi:hypothetical protein
MSDLSEQFKMLIKVTESNWESVSPNPLIWGYQKQKNTKWLPGLSDAEIAELEGIIGKTLPYEVKDFLKVSAGLATEQINLNHNGEAGKVGYMQKWFLRKDAIRKYPSLREYNDEVTCRVIQEENLYPDFNLPDCYLLPVYSHRCLVIDSRDLSKSVVLSIMDEDIIIYGHSFYEYLCNEFENRSV